MKLISKILIGLVGLALYQLAWAMERRIEEPVVQEEQQQSNEFKVNLINNLGHLTFVNTFRGSGGFDLSFTPDGTISRIGTTFIHNDESLIGQLFIVVFERDNQYYGLVPINRGQGLAAVLTQFQWDGATLSSKVETELPFESGDQFELELNHDSLIFRNTNSGLESKVE